MSGILNRTRVKI